MNFNRLFAVVLVSFLALLSRTEAKLTKVPSNTRVLVGESVRLQCLTERRDYPPSWSHIKIGSTEPRDVYMTVKNGHDMIVGRMTEEYYNIGRFRMHEDRTTGEYSLDITNVQMEDAGRYMCTAKGGLGQQATAELGVIEPYPRCSSNITEAIGENICNHRPDHIGFSCSFRYSGNTLPSVHWVKTDEPGQIVRLEEAKWTSVRGMAVSTFVVRADGDDLNGSSFKCVISSSSDADDEKISCSTPIINVLKIANSTESRILVQPKEVQCNPLPELTKTGCKWVKRKLEDSTVIVVTEDSLLNLYRPEFDSGVYVCIIEYNIRGQPCPVEALTVTYEHAEPQMGESTATPKLTIILTVVLSVGITLAVVVLVIVIVRRRDSRTLVYTEEERTFSMHPDYRVRANSYKSGTASDKKIEEMKLFPAGSSSSGSSSGIGSADSSPSREEESLKAEDEKSKDTIDFNFTTGTLGGRQLRNQLAEERALARMRKNAALLQGSDNEGFSSSADGTDIAEGIGRSVSEKKGKDE